MIRNAARCVFQRTVPVMSAMYLRASRAAPVTPWRAFGAQATSQVQYPGIKVQWPEVRRALSSSNGRKKEQEPQLARVKKPAPSWEATAVINGEFRTLKLSDFSGKVLVMVFYPMDFTFVCPTELIAYSDRIEEFRALNAEVIGISIDTEHSHLAWTNVPRDQGGIDKIRIPLVADVKKEIAKHYGVLYEEKGFAFRGLFIIDTDSRVRVIQINDTEIGRSVDETLRLIEAIQFANEHGEVCPADWKKGGRTITPNPKDSKEYFAKIGT